MSRQIRFERSLYRPEAVQAAVVAYADFARIEVLPAGDATEVTILPSEDYDAELVIGGFCNHVLYETIASQRADAVGGD